VATATDGLVAVITIVRCFLGDASGKATNLAVH
jgi:hypothetical protein